MSIVLLATRSADKVREVREILAAVPVDVRSLDGAHIRWSPVEDALEVHDSFLANAREKAEYFAKLSGLSTVAEDSGLEVLALGGAPGVRSKRFAQLGAAGAWVTGSEGREPTPAERDAANNAELLRRLLGAEAERRRASYVCVAVLVRGPGAVPESFSGRCWGRILEAAVGTNGFGYDPLFWHAGLGKSFGEATAEEKHGVSHRGEAFRALAAALAARPL